MATDPTAVTLDAIVARLAALERDNAVLKNQNHALEQETRDLRAQVAVRPASVPSRAKPVPVPVRERLSRRGMLRRGLRAAAVTVGAGVLLQRTAPIASAETTSFDIVRANRVEVTQANSDFAAVEGLNVAAGAGVVGVSSEGGPGIHGTGRTGVLGLSNATSGHGVRGEGDIGVYGKSARTGWEGVYGQHTGTSGHGVVGDGKGANIAGVLARNPQGHGVRGEGVIGVVGAAAAGGYGGQFEGGKAQLRLVPAARVGKPTTGSHTKGELYMDSAGTLFICTAATTATTAAVWKKVSVTAV